MQISRLRLSGFKSFVDPTELDIEPGLTGVVGPNGCGKSNLVEALRWVMGETSAKRMRGGDMDDVIFGGTAARPARNIAEVSLRVENSDRTAPAELNDADQLDVARRIERAKGSHYRVNGREVRARDVQLLFADAGTGARSAGLVSQGRIGALINAKPSERRILLEEAANIRGLYARRHEAELRLRAAETNLSRVEDVLNALRSQLQGLRQQARQASRYRNLNEQIRRLEAVMLHRRWHAGLAERQTAGTALTRAELEVGRLTEDATRLATRRTEAAAGLPDLRDAEAAAAAALQRHTIARGELDNEARRIATARSEGETRLRQIGDDVARETTLAADATDALARLDGEAAGIEAARAGEDAAQAAAAEHLTKANREAEEVDTAIGRLTERIATVEARRGALERQVRLARDRIEKLGRQRDGIVEQRRRLEEQAVAADTLDAATRDLERLVNEAASVRAGLTEAETARTTASDGETTARAAFQEADAAAVRVETEVKALAELLAETGGADGPPVLDRLTVQEGREAALAAALAEDLSAPLAEEAAAEAGRRWIGLPELAADAWPDGVEPLAAMVAAPPALARRLSRVGFVADAETAARLQPSLGPGQRLVSPDGGLWRWDGFTVKAGAPSAAEARMRQRNRHATLAARLSGLVATRSETSAAHDAARAAHAAALTAERAARTSVTETDRALDAARQHKARLDARLAETRTRLSGLDDAAGRLAAEVTENEGQLTVYADELAGLEDVAALRAESGEQRRVLAERRTALAEARSEHDRLRREADARRERLAAIVRERASWVERDGRATARLAELAERRDAEARELERLAARPAEIAEQREQLAALIAESEARRKEAADRLAVAETALAEVERESREVERVLAAAREDRVRAEAALEQANRGLAELKDRIAERLECRPEEILEQAGIAPDEVLPEGAEVRERHDRLVAERERLGPVNLRAEQEVAEIEARIEGMERERDDLTGAIAKLRSAIARLNREGRERLLASFEMVNAHFQELFVRLFGGGRAHLTLVEDDDPLDAGLEIMASPPGKKLQVMSLLSGGEQALTALALVFAAFLTNPSPICVLDEVDAPLDDSNVDRFCSLLDDITEKTGTRFLVITHHRLTMARMDRLFGVTMSERGISQLVSVDLTRAERLRESA